MEQRDRWATKIGLILAMAGNAIGLGNFWRFPYQAAVNGGGAFMIPYFVALFLLGVPIMWAEWVTGRYGGKYGHGTLGPTFYLMARESLKPRSAVIFGMIGGMFAFSVTTLLNSYYLHIIGWSAAYTYFSATGAYFGKDSVEFLISYLSNNTQVFLFWGLSVALLGIAVAQGVSKGIERWVKVMMPVLYVAAILLVLRSLTLGSPVKPEWSSIKGFEYLWEPRFSEVTFKSALAAAGQIFFTLSLGMGIIQNYASYLGPEDDVALSGLATVSLNEFAEVILGGSIAIPIAFAYLGPEKAIAGGVGLAYIALPNVFMNMPGGQLFGAIWFLLLWFAGFTSAIAMYNYLTALLEEDLKINRRTGAAIVFLLYLILGLPVVLDPTKASLDLYYLTELDNWVGSYLLVVLGLFDIIVAVWLFKPDNFWEELHKGAYIKIPGWIKPIIMYIAPIYTIILLLGSTQDYYNEGYFKAVPGYVGAPEYANWVWYARGMMLFILIIGAIEAYLAIKKKYGEELAKNEVIVKL